QIVEIAQRWLFDSQAALARISAEWPRSRLGDLYNSIAGHGKVQKFANRSKAVSRIWEAIQPLGGNAAGGAAPQAVPKGQASETPQSAARRASLAKRRKRRRAEGQFA